MPDGTLFRIVKSAAERGGERVEFEVTMAPGAMGPPKHDRSSWGQAYRRDAAATRFV
jgi:hypothetical protein